MHVGHDVLSSGEADNVPDAERETRNLASLSRRLLTPTAVGVPL